MTIRYTATLNNKHLSLTALYPDGGQEVIAILPVTELGALINRNNRLMHLSFSTPFREITETLLVDTVDTERPGHHIGRMLSAIDSCLSAAYAELPARKTSFMRGLIYGAGLVLALLTAVTAGYILLKPDSDSPLRVPVTESVTETAPLHIDKEIVRSVAPSETKNEIVHPAPQEMQETSATPAITADKRLWSLKPAVIWPLYLNATRTGVCSPLISPLVMNAHSTPSLTPHASTAVFWSPRLSNWPGNSAW